MYRIYGKVIKNYCFNNYLHKPMSKFQALDKYGCPVSRLVNACGYDTREEAQAVINRALSNLHKHNHDGCVLFEIRKA